MISLLAGAVGAFAMALSTPLHAQQRISFIRDAEVESTIRAYATPLLAAAGLDPSAIRVNLVNDSTLNAFVADGLNMFINTGLLIRADNSLQVIGVIAHETGHISGGHLARFRDGLRGALAESIVTMVVGALAAAAARSPEAAAAALMAGQHVGERSFLRYSREMERSADQAGIGFLERTGQSPRGLLEFLQVLGDQELMALGRQDPYVRTHPVTGERIDFVRNALAHSRFANTPPRPEFERLHRRMRAKLVGFLEPGRTFQIYPPSNQGLEARYARAIAASRRPDYPRALAGMDALLKEQPNDPYFLEAKGQFLFEAGKPNEALPLYERAVEILPNEPLLRTSLGQVQVETGRPELTKKAIENLDRARTMDTENSETYRLLAIAYARDGQTGLADLAHAERMALVDKRPDARFFAERAMRDLPRGSPGWVRAQDIRQAMDKANDKNDR